MSNGSYKLVQMNIRQPTLNKISVLQDTLGANNRTDAVKAAIDVAEIVARAIKNGGRVVIEEKDGSRSKLVIPGISEN